MTRLDAHRNWWAGTGWGLVPLGHEAVAGGDTPGESTQDLQHYQAQKRASGWAMAPYPGKTMSRYVALPGLEGG